MLLRLSATPTALATSRRVRRTQVVRNAAIHYAMSMNDDRVRKAVEALRAGDNRRARRLLGEVVGDNPDNVAAWWYLSAVLEDPAQKISCLRRVLDLRPDHREAAQLLSRLERRSVTVTPPMGTVRPVIDTVAVGTGDLQVARRVGDEAHQQASDATVAVVAVAIALAAIILTVILVVTGQAQGVLGIHDPGQTPTLPPLEFSVPACTQGEDLEPQIVFINNTSATIAVSQGPSGEEVRLLDLGPGAQASVAARAGVPTRYAVEASGGDYGPGGAIIEVPAQSICRVPIQ